MTKTRFKRHSSLGMECVKCGSGLIAPEWTEFRNSGKSIMFGTAGIVTTSLRPLSRFLPTTSL
jgi:hypothetical protein